MTVNFGPCLIEKADRAGVVEALVQVNDDGKIPMIIRNAHEREMTIFKGQSICSMSSVDIQEEDGARRIQEADQTWKPGESTED